MWRHCIHCSVEMQKSAATMENCFMGPQKVKHRIVIFPEQLSTCPQELRTNIQKKRKLAHKSQKLETYVLQLMNRKIKLYSHSGILFSHKKKWSTDAWCNMEEQTNHCAKWKKPDIRGCMSHDSIFVWNIQDRKVHRDRKEQGILGARKRGEFRMTPLRRQAFL